MAINPLFLLKLVAHEEYVDPARDNGYQVSICCEVCPRIVDNIPTLHSPSRRAFRPANRDMALYLSSAKIRLRPRKI